MFAVNLIAVFFENFLTHLADGGDEIRGNTSQLIRIRGINKDTNRKLLYHLFCAFFLPDGNLAENFSGSVLVIQFVDLSTGPEKLYAACACFIALLSYHFCKGNLIYANLQTDNLSFLHIRTDFYDQFRVFS